MGADAHMYSLFDNLLLPVNRSFPQTSFPMRITVIVIKKGGDGEQC